MTKFLKNLIEKRKKEIEALKAKLETSKDAQEVRDLGKTLLALKEELQDAEKQLKEAEKDDNQDDAGSDSAGKTDDDATGQRSAFNPMQARNLASFAMNPQGEQRTRNALDSMEYRKAFMQYVQTGE